MHLWTYRPTQHSNHPQTLGLYSVGYGKPSHIVLMANVEASDLRGASYLHGSIIFMGRAILTKVVFPYFIIRSAVTKSCKLIHIQKCSVYLDVVHVYAYVGDHVVYVPYMPVLWTVDLVVHFQN